MAGEEINNFISEGWYKDGKKDKNKARLDKLDELHITKIREREVRFHDPGNFRSERGGEGVAQ